MAILTDNILKTVKMLLLDVDGVLTRGDIIYDDSGRENKAFNVKDGLGIRLLAQAGIDIGIVTARRSKALTVRCRDLGIERIYDGVSNKGAVLDLILSENRVKAKDIAFIGDDLPDLSLMRRIGVPIATADAHETVRAMCRMTTTAKGGSGAVREVCERILKSQGLWEDILKCY